VVAKAAAEAAAEAAAAAVVVVVVLVLVVGWGAGGREYVEDPTTTRNSAGSWLSGSMLLQGV
jgi:hypothetical protein